MLCTDTGKMTALENSDNTGLLLVSGTKDLKQKSLESAISPISSNEFGNRHEGRTERYNLCDASSRTSDLKDLVRKCLSEYKEWEERLCTEKPALVKGAATSSIRHLSTSDFAALVTGRKEGAKLEKSGVKRGFELVDASPTQEFCPVKKSNTEFRRGCKITEFPEKQNTGLTTEICCLKLAGVGGLPEMCTNKSQVNGFSYTEQHKDGKSVAALIPKNLLHDLDAGCEDEKNKHTNFSLIYTDDEKPLASMSMGSDFSLPEVSGAESHIEKQHSDLDESVKDHTFGESKMANISTAFPCCFDVLPKDVEKLVKESKSLHTEQDKLLNGTMEVRTDVHSSPSVDMIEAMNLFKKNVVAFRSYNSPINMSNTSEPSRISTISIDGMDISACSGSYPMAITPAQKGRSYSVRQVGTNTHTLNVALLYQMTTYQSLTSSHEEFPYMV